VQFCGRPPHRGAWIEMACASSLRVTVQVAPRTGGRGLKFPTSKRGSCEHCRPPHRGAWIEIVPLVFWGTSADVAPRTGGRGLKLWDKGDNARIAGSPPAQGGVD